MDGRVSRKLRKLPEAVTECIKASINFRNGIHKFKDVMENSDHQNTKRSSTGKGEKYQSSVQSASSGEISTKELIKKVLYYLSLPASEAENFENFDLFMDRLIERKQKDGKNIVYNFMENKYSSLLERLSENLKGNNSAISLAILEKMADSMKEDKKSLL